ncbi:hypothetical protein F5Y18DRAFT_403279 [Xylariaceae sp. FL1019]|nr:hypothetical protein F5Y18DRAFT_403279 [Xylariaceae sp. FL1019]
MPLSSFRRTYSLLILMLMTGHCETVHVFQQITFIFIESITDIVTCVFELRIILGQLLYVRFCAYQFSNCAVRDASLHSCWAGFSVRGRR